MNAAAGISAARARRLRRARTVLGRAVDLLVAEELNGGPPRGDGWHKRLLTAMAVEQKGIRPAVISPTLLAALIPFLGFRHVVRQAYGFQLDVEKIAALEKSFHRTWRLFSREIKAFCAFLESRPQKGRR